MREKLKICFIIFILLMVCVSLFNFAEATDWDNVDAFDSKHASKVDSAARQIVGAALNVIRIAGTGISIIMITVIGVKYMMAAPSERADIKKSAIPFVIGAIVLFAGSQIVGIIKDFSGTIGSSSGTSSN